jgi:hypothetical protein
MERALAERLGLVVKTSDLEKLRRQFYVARREAREAGDYRFASLSFQAGLRTNELLIVRKQEVPDAEPEG